MCAHRDNFDKTSLDLLANNISECRCGAKICSALGFHSFQYIPDCPRKFQLGRLGLRSQPSFERRVWFHGCVARWTVLKIYAIAGSLQRNAFDTERWYRRSCHEQFYSQGSNLKGFRKYPRKPQENAFGKLQGQAITKSSMCAPSSIQ